MNIPNEKISVAILRNKLETSRKRITSNIYFKRRSYQILFWILIGFKKLIISKIFCLSSHKASVVTVMLRKKSFKLQMCLSCLNIFTTSRHSSQLWKYRHIYFYICFLYIPFQHYVSFEYLYMLYLNDHNTKPSYIKQYCISRCDLSENTAVTLNENTVAKQLLRIGNVRFICVYTLSGLGQ